MLAMAVEIWHAVGREQSAQMALTSSLPSPVLLHHGRQHYALAPRTRRQQLDPFSRYGHSCESLLIRFSPVVLDPSRLEELSQAAAMSDHAAPLDSSAKVVVEHSAAADKPAVEDRWR